jgi:hypothetical protein
MNRYFPKSPGRQRSYRQRGNGHGSPSSIDYGRAIVPLN